MAITSYKAVVGYYNSAGTPDITTAVTGQLSVGWIPIGAPILTDAYGQCTQMMVKTDSTPVVTVSAYTVVTAANPQPPDATWNAQGDPLWIDTTTYLQAYTKGGVVEENVRELWNRTLTDAGLTLAAGSFEEGGTLTSSSQALLCYAYDQAYTWAGSFPKTVPINSTPDSTGGISAGAWVSVSGVTLRKELSSPGGTGLFADNPKPITWTGFAGGADPAGSSDSTAALSSAYDAAESGTIIFIPKGMYKEGSTSKTVDSDSIWLNRDFGLGVGITTETRKSPLLITVGNPDVPVLSSEHTRSGINITAIGRGGQHIDCIRATTINYSTNGNGNTAIYAAALSTPGALWTAALHGEIKHQGNSTIAVSAEAASYSSTGTFYGAVLNNTTGTAAETHPSTGAPATLHPSATALYITGSNQRGEMGQWIRGIRFSPLSMRDAGTLVRDESACAQGWWSLSSSSKSNADILLEGTSPQGIIIQGTYSTGNGIRLGSGIGIAYEGTGAIKTKYNSSTLRWGLFSGAVERVTFHTATPGMYFNGVRVVAGQQAAIDNAAAGTEISTINRILSAMRNHGLIAA